jgi:predicted nucleic acid-binding protein
MSGKIYIEACPIIDMAEYEAKPSKGREMEVWLCKQALAAARDEKNQIKVYTSMLSVAECTTIAPNLPNPPAETKRFLDMLLLSGKSGITIVQIRQVIAIRARDLRWASEINLKGADAIHVATAIEMKCDELWTRDGRIWRKRTEIGQLGLRVINPQETTVLPEQFRNPELPFAEIVTEPKSKHRRQIDLS